MISLCITVDQLVQSLPSSAVPDEIELSPKPRNPVELSLPRPSPSLSLPLSHDTTLVRCCLSLFYYYLLLLLLLLPGLFRACSLSTVADSTAWLESTTHSCQACSGGFKAKVELLYVRTVVVVELAGRASRQAGWHSGLARGILTRGGLFTHCTYRASSFFFLDDNVVVPLWHSAVSERT